MTSSITSEPKESSKQIPARRPRSISLQTHHTLRQLIQFWKVWFEQNLMIKLKMNSRCFRFFFMVMLLLLVKGSSQRPSIYRSCRGIELAELFTSSLITKLDLPPLQNHQGPRFTAPMLHEWCKLQFSTLMEMIQRLAFVLHI